MKRAKIILVLDVPNEVGENYPEYIQNIRTIMPTITETTFLPPDTVTEVIVTEKNGSKSTSIISQLDFTKK